MTESAQEVISRAWKDALIDINSEVFKYSMVKAMPADWCEENIILPDNTSRYSGAYSYDLTPYWREPVNLLHETNPTRYCSILKAVQIGATQGVVIPGILYIIAVDPDNTLFTAGDLMLAKKTIEERLDTILRESGLDHLIRPHAVKKGNQRTGDTAASKEYSGGTLTALGTGSANSFRYYSAKISFVDDFDTAPRDLGGEGSVKSLIEGRQNSFGDSAKTFFISTPTITATSNIWEQYQLGTQKKWHWPCHACGEYMVMDWKITLEDGSYAGMVWEVDEKGKLIKESVAFKCPHCRALTYEKQKSDLNKLGQWISTVPEPAEELHESYSMNAIIQPPGFTGWVKLVQEWLKANPPGQRANVTLLKAFMNLRLGLPFEEMGEAPKSTALMQNMREYHPGIIPDKTCEEDGNGKIVLTTLSCDLGGIMNDDVEDVRLDWEILAHASNGVTYSIDHGSIGTFKRAFEKGKGPKEKEDDDSRVKWTYKAKSTYLDADGKAQNNSVWPVFEELVKGLYSSDDPDRAPWSIYLTCVDTGFFEKYATQFILDMQAEQLKVYGVKGRTDLKYRPIQRETVPVKRSPEYPKRLYIVEVNQMKDDLAENMKLTRGMDGSQPGGFMNYPQSNDGKYTYKSYFSHFEAEKRVEERNAGLDVVGYKWVKKHSNVINHFWDVRVYGLAAPLIYLDLVRQSDPAKYKNLTWEEFVLLVTG